MAERKTCPHCGAVGWSAYEKATCHQCKKSPDEPVMCKTCIHRRGDNPILCRTCGFNYGNYSEDKGDKHND